MAFVNGTARVENVDVASFRTRPHIAYIYIYIERERERNYILCIVGGVHLVADPNGPHPHMRPTFPPIRCIVHRWIDYTLIRMDYTPLNLWGPDGDDRGGACG